MTWTDEHSYFAGRLLASLHAASDDFVSRHQRFRQDCQYLIDRPLAAIRPFLADRPDNWAYLEGIASRLRERITAHGGELDWGVCHGDFTAKNIHAADDGTLTILDFDHCCTGWRAYDFASALRAAVDQKKRSIWGAFVTGYSDVRPLGAADLAAVPLFHAVRRLWGLGLLADNVPEWGTSALSDERIEHCLRFLREWEAEYA